MEKQKMTWEGFGMYVENLAKKIQDSKQRFGQIFAIERGGLIVGVCLSHLLKIPVTKHLFQMDTLIVDDIMHTGKTLEKFQQKKATLFHRTDEHARPDFSVEGTDKWIIFPWETEETTELNNEGKRTY